MCPSANDLCLEYQRLPKTACASIDWRHSAVGCYGTNRSNTDKIAAMLLDIRILRENVCAKP